MAQRKWEFVANGFDMGHVHHGGLAIDDERELFRKSRKALSKAAGPVHGLAFTGTVAIPEHATLLAEQGFGYVTDWANDDMPYMGRLDRGESCAMPLTYEWSDRHLLVQHNLTVEEYAAQVWQAFVRLDAEAEQYRGGRILSLSITPWFSAIRIGSPSWSGCWAAFRPAGESGMQNPAWKSWKTSKNQRLRNA